ncbi:hypothetical protein B0H66DRAFT_170088 [Apodospora peruviana]|uniref:Fungal N-terminal domain-containing protein n=1 Tax=Apodospora peruviana TaxID=516989 RepID=A0AAE0MBV4_9PEZI|nr:hypothetical protein B0H66DRAFT_170088 [Apodospora peruviana]
MDPLSITSAAFDLAMGIAKASIAILGFSRDVRDASNDLDAISAELEALTTILDSLGHGNSRATSASIPDELVVRVNDALDGCSTVVEQIEENMKKYKRNKVFSKTSWAVFGRDDTQRLRTSLAAYRMALSLGVHAISGTPGFAVKEDTTVIPDSVATIKLDTDDIFAHVNDIHLSGGARGNRKVEDCISDMAVLSSFAETTHLATITDTIDMGVDNQTGTSVERGNSPERQPRTTKGPSHHNATIVESEENDNGRGSPHSFHCADSKFSNTDNAALGNKLGGPDRPESSSSTTTGATDMQQPKEPGTRPELPERADAVTEVATRHPPRLEDSHPAAPQPDETVIFSAGLRSCDFFPNFEAIYNAEPYSENNCKVFWIESNPNNGSRLVITSQSNETLVNYHFLPGRPIFVQQSAYPNEFSAEYALFIDMSEEAYGITLLVPGTTVLLFEDADARINFYWAVTGMFAQDLDKNLSIIRLGHYDITTTRSSESLSSIALDLAGQKVWSHVWVLHWTPPVRTGASSSGESNTSTVPKMGLRIMVDAARRVYLVDRLNSAAPHLHFRLHVDAGQSLKHMLEHWLPPSAKTTTLLAPVGYSRTHEAITGALNFLSSEPTIRKFEFTSALELHRFQLELTGFEVLFDAFACDMTILTPIKKLRKYWPNARVQVVRRDGFGWLLAFPEFPETNFTGRTPLQVRMAGLKFFVLEDIDRVNNSTSKLPPATINLSRTNGDHFLSPLRSTALREDSPGFVCLERDPNEGGAKQFNINVKKQLDFDELLRVAATFKGTSVTKGTASAV